MAYLSDSAFFGRVFAGYSWQVGHDSCLASKGDVDFLRRRASSNQIASETFNAPPPGVAAFTMRVTGDNGWIASVRGRAGFTFGKGLLYVTGGPAWTRTSYSVSATGLAAGAGAAGA